MIRERINHAWEFVSNPTISVQNLAHSDQLKGTIIDLPHDAMISEPRTADTPSRNQSGFYPGGTYCYIKKLLVPQPWKDEKVTLEFEGVYKNATVYINGVYAGGCANGYTEFLIEANDFLRYGQENEIKVMVNNQAQPSCRWYSGSGIYRNVNLLRSSLTHLSHKGAQIHTSYVSPELADLKIRMELCNEMPCPVKFTMLAEILDQQGKVVSRDTLPMMMTAHSNETLYRHMQIHQPQLWSCEHPFLYRYRISLIAGGKELDLDEGRLGIRTLAMDGQQGLLLNGVSTKLRGSCIHHDNGILGACAHPEAEQRRVKIMKEAGFNCIRCAHNPASRALLDACDAQGMLVIDEYSDMWTIPKNAFDDAQHIQRNWKQDLKALVRKNFNHPSAILYCIGNEIPEAGNEYGAALCRKMDAWIKQMDDTRLTVNGTNALLACSSRLGEIIKDIIGDHSQMQAKNKDNTMDDVSAINSIASLLHGPLGDAVMKHPVVTEMLTPFKDATDITGLNYMPSRYVLEKELHPDRLVLGTEEYPSDIARLWALVKQYPHVIGDMTWTGYDYIGEAGIGIFYYDGTANFSPHWPDRLAYIGDIDITGFRRPISYFREIVYGLRKEPYIAVLRMDHTEDTASKTSWMFKDNIASWTWHGFEGKTVFVDVYSDADEIELLLNDDVVGREPAGENNQFTAAFKVQYTSGELKAVAIRDGERSETSVLKTAEQEVRISASVESKQTVPACGDLLFVPICFKDKHGNVNPSIHANVSIDVRGALTVQAFGTASPQGTETYSDQTWPAYDGRLLAVLRAGEGGGYATVILKSEGMQDEVIQIPIK